VRSLVPALGDWAEVFLVYGETFVLSAWGHADPDKGSLIPEYRKREALAAEAEALKRAAAGEEIVANRPAPGRPLENQARPSLSQLLSVGSYLVLPLRKGRSTVCVVRLVRSEPSPFREQSVVAARQLGQQTELALA
jgi:hypothetical protein